jgi:pentatricopeptide repeat protein
LLLEGDISKAKVEKRRDMYAACAEKVLDDFLQDVDNGPARDQEDVMASANDERAFVTAATACARCLRPDAAVFILRKCKRRAALGIGDWPTTQLYNVVLDAQASAGLNVPALLLLDEMAADSTLQLDAVTYNICLRVCVKSGDFRKAEKLLDEMQKSDRLRPDVVSFTTAIRSCCARRDVSLEAAEKDGADKKKWPKNDAGSAKAALRLLDRAINAQATNDVTFRTALRACVGAPSEPPRPAAFAALGLTVSILRDILRDNAPAPLRTARHPSTTCIRRSWRGCTALWASRR